MTLKELFTNIANALRKRNNSTYSIKATDFAAEIEKRTALEKLMLNDIVPPIASGGITLNADEFQSMTEIRQYWFAGRRGFNEITLPDTVTKIGVMCFYDCITKNFPKGAIHIGKGVTSVPQSCFGWSTQLKFVEFGGNITSIAASAFSNTLQDWATNTLTIKFLNNTEVPTVANTNAFACSSVNGTGRGIIVVPDSLKDEWVTATNWSTVVELGAFRILSQTDYEKEFGE
jgi:hypothetical protein